MASDIRSGFQTAMDSWVRGPRTGTFTEVIKDDRVSGASFVLASVCEFQNGEPHQGAARFTVHDVCPSEGKVSVAITNSHPQPLEFQISLYICTPFNEIRT
ncbi:hypothetical protein HH310_31385 [Actinoplanes sp. TBRC 11911]|uniref:hypothetical protein n=1 Tax=Actinoplanes sp. TBRC 11911 TaxID=2729386 RepID=UPI00145F5CCF|nr:hypothetical protein [Actinoplanes sp. TBRC 11911]NMO55674.1 hypothetical protein [Actinoplanes sp. TBRC 11911]